jgi:hypothetical protein
MTNDIMNWIMDYETGSLNDEDSIKLFATLVQNGMAWQLQGHYGRTAQALIDWGAIDTKGNINYEKLDSVAFF